jgi:hypothetical protein
MVRTFMLVTLVLALSARASPVALRAGDPALDGKDYLISEADFRSILSAGRDHLSKLRPRPSIYRVTVVSAGEVHALYAVERADDYKLWLVIERTKNQWHVAREDWLSYR